MQIGSKKKPPKSFVHLLRANKSIGSSLLGKELIGRMQSSLGQSLTGDELKEIEKMGINAIKEKVKKLEAERCKDDHKFNRLFFEVLYTSIDEYIYNKV